MRLVKFDNGKFGVLRGWWFFTTALDVRKADYWWFSRANWHAYCMGTEQEARNAMTRLKPKWRAVK